MNEYFIESLKYLIRSPKLVRKEMNEVRYLYSLNKNELFQYMEKRFLHIFRRAYNLSPFYSSFYRKHGIELEDVKSLNDISKLPILTKDLVKDNYSNILIDPKWRMKRANTSGTTGTPLTVYHSYKAIRMEQAYIYVNREKCGFSSGEKLASLRGNLDRRRFKMFIPISNTLFLSSYQLNSENILRYYQELLKFKPKAIEGYPSSLYTLCLFLKDQNLNLNIPLAFTSSETLFPFQRELIEEILNTKLFDHYGCTERTIFLSENRDRNFYKEAPGYSINDIKDEYIITTSLINDSFPLLNYQVNDVVEINEGGEITSIIGRREDVLFCKDLSRIGRIDHIFKGVEGIKLAQIIQHKIGEIQINIVPDSNLKEETRNKVLRKAEERFGKQNMVIHLNEIAENDIILTKRGKYNLVKSYVES